MKSTWLVSLCAALAVVPGWGAVEYPGAVKPGKAESASTEDGFGLSNNLIEMSAGYTLNGGLYFGGVEKPGKGKLLAGSGEDEIFTLRLANGEVLKASGMKVTGEACKELKPNAKAARKSERLPGKALCATFHAPDGSLRVDWQAELRDGSHYVRQIFTIKALKDVAFEEIIPMQYRVVSGGEPSISGNTTHGTLVVNDEMFMGLETPMSVMRVGGAASAVPEWRADAWSPESFQGVFAVPQAIVDKYGAWCGEMNGPMARHVKASAGEVNFARAGECRVTFRYKSGNLKLNMIGVILLDANKQMVSADIHRGSAGTSPVENTYTVRVPAPGKYTIQYWVETRTEAITSSGTIAHTLPLRAEETAQEPESRNMVRGSWVRKTTLRKGQSWQVSSVVGLFAPGQKRRSFLAYSERERAVPYRPFVHYNDWYEVGIDRKDNADPLKRNSEEIWMGILQTWNREMYRKRKTSMDAFVLDDGWDDFNSLWGFHAGFPNGFSAINREAVRMGAGIGTWLGPVGGYGGSKKMRIGYWNKMHPQNRISNFELSNKEYFDAFVGRCRDMIRNYDMRYFKFDGISTRFHAKGPDALEDAEGIISVVNELRLARADIFINATVGTWASPFWYHYVDSTWRQENDFDQKGNMGDKRDRWITYRDGLVYRVYVQGAPLCPINSIMTHGTIITRHGPPRVMSTEPANCIKEMRAAFGCGSSLQEVYADSELLNQENGRLWDELAACIAWVRRNADVLDDIHWVGGNPWDDKDGSIYGWASWNKKKCTLTLRNSSSTPKTLRTTLRELFEVPDYLAGGITLSASFADQTLPRGIPAAKTDIDRVLHITLRPMEVIVMEGKNAHTTKKKKQGKR